MAQTAKLQCLVVVGETEFQFAEGAVSQATVVIGGAESRIQLYRPLISFGRLAVFLAAPKNVPGPALNILSVGEVDPIPSRVISLSETRRRTPPSGRFAEERSSVDRSPGRPSFRSESC